MLVVTTPVFAQKTGDGEISLGYSVLHSSAPQQTYPGGFVIGFAGQLKKALSIAGEFGQHFATVVVPSLGVQDRMSVITFTAGPRFTISTKQSNSTAKQKYHPFA